MNKEKLLISSCLCGENVKYNGGNNLIIRLDELQEKFEFIQVCPEVLGGLDTPRVPSEIQNFEPLKIENKEGLETTQNFINGAKQTLDIVLTNQIKIALMKSNSPSCGNDKVYDGNFDGTLIDNSGVTTTLLMQYGVKVFNEKEIDELLKFSR
jgi:uncharacterized protein YbbK (DUF523 family)